MVSVQFVIVTRTNIPPTACPLLAELNLKLIRVSPPAGPPAAVPTPAAYPSPGGRSTMADEASTSSSKGLATAPFGLVATVAEEYNFEDNFCWDGDESGVTFSVSSALTKSNNNVAFYYPSCKHAVVESLRPPLAPPPLCCANRPINLPSASSSKCIVISKHLMSIVTGMSAASILPTSGRRSTMDNSGATDHMFPDKSAFISYRLVTNLQVRMGSNSFLPVLGRGLAIISLYGQRILIRNVLHVPGLVAPLYSLHAHFVQPGCGFIGASGVGILVYFPTLVLSIDTSKDCHLAFKSLEHSASLDTLHYVQPRCALSLYPSELASHTASKSTVVIEDNSSASGASDELIWSYPQPKCPRPVQPLSPVSVADTPLPMATLDSVSAQLCSLADAVSSLTPLASTHPPHDDSCKPWSSPVLASTMLREEIISLLHRKGSSLPSVRP
jgi:hypothetical protein